MSYLAIIAITEVIMLINRANNYTYKGAFTKEIDNS